MWHSCWMSALLSVAPTVAFTTLPTQCTPYLPLVPTVMPATFINPSPPPPTRCPNLSASVPSAQGLSSASHPSQAPSRAYWRCYVYGINLRVLRGSLVPGHAGCGLSNDEMPPIRPKHGCLRLGRNYQELYTPIR